MNKADNNTAHPCSHCDLSTFETRISRNFLYEKVTYLSHKVSGRYGMDFYINTYNDGKTFTLCAVDASNEIGMKVDISYCPFCGRKLSQHP